MGPHHAGLSWTAASLFLVFIAGPGARAADRQAVRRMTDTRVPFGLRGRWRGAVCGRRLHVRIVLAPVGVDVRPGRGALRSHAGRSRWPRVGAAGGCAHSGARTRRGPGPAGPRSGSSTGTGTTTRTAACSSSSSAAATSLSEGRGRKCRTSYGHEDGLADHGSSPWFGGQSRSPGSCSTSEHHNLSADNRPQLLLRFALRKLLISDTLPSR